ncbi:MAG TPA: oligosaccharide flippase family protein [bacterium]|nr:oligosaccharide flippase family protein [bacterium]HPN43655.1 oligosaccharide flippase family protein [bacterium]
MSIFNSLKRLLKHSAVYGMGHILNRMIVFLLLPLHTNVFNEAEMGVAGVMFSWLAIFTVVYTYGLDTAFFRFYILEDSPEGKKRVLSTAFLTILGTSVLITCVFYLLANPLVSVLFDPATRALSIDLPYLIKLLCAILFFDALTFMPFLAMRAEEKSVLFIFFKFLNVIITVAFNALYILVLKSGIEGIFLANLWASLLTFVLLLPIIVKRFSLTFSKSILKELLWFGLPYLPSTLSVSILDTIDRVFLERLAGVEQVGIYSQGAKLGMFMALFVTAFRFAWHPYFLSTSKLENAKIIFSKIFTYVMLACFSVFIILCLFIDNIVRLKIGGFTILGPDFWSATVVVPPIFLAYIFYAAYVNFIIGIYLYKKTKYLPLITLAGMVGNLAALYLLIPVLGILGAGIARVVAYIIMAVYLYVIANKLYPIRYEWGRVLKMSGIVLIIFLLGLHPLAGRYILVKFALMLAFPILLYVTGFFDKAELMKIKQLATKLPIPGRR